jgi:uncharacterized membrane protein
MNDDNTNNSAFWKLGIFYYNPEDKRTFLPKRFGIGWTLNFARPAAYLFILVPIAVVLILLRK